MVDFCMSDNFKTILSACGSGLDRRNFVKFSASAIALTLMAPGAQAEGPRRIAGRDALLRALAEGPGGTVLLADGDYGDIDLTRSFDPPLVLIAENPRRARFSIIRLNRAEGIVFDGVKSSGIFVRQQSGRITVRNSQVDGMIHCLDVSDITLTDNEVTGGKFGVSLNLVERFSLRHNKIHRVGEDLLRITGRSSDGLVEYNDICDTIAKKPIHPDIIQFFNRYHTTPTRIVIRRNLLRDPGVKGMEPGQGVFVSDPAEDGFRDILIEENLINTASFNTIAVNGGDATVKILNNSLMSRRGGGGCIRLVSQKIRPYAPVISGNVMRRLVLKNHDIHPLERNFIYKNTPEVTLFSGTGERWQDFIPVAGSVLERLGMGATRFLAELQDSQHHEAKDPIRIGPSWLQG